VVRLVVIVVAALSLSACASREQLREMRAQQRAKIEAAKLPAVQLNAAQMAKLQELAPKSDITWLGAGRQADGRIFVCHVVTGKTLFGGKSVALFTGTFEADGSYARSPARYLSKQAIVADCQAHGFDPPVTIKTTVTVVRY
jgi:Tfp pilus assembly protein PilV